LDGLRAKSEVAEVRSERLLLSIGRLEGEYAGLVEELVYEVNLRKGLEVKVEELERDLRVSVDREAKAVGRLKFVGEGLKQVSEMLHWSSFQEVSKRLRQSRNQSSS
jgi:hypothetical protein